MKNLDDQAPNALDQQRQGVESSTATETYVHLFHDPTDPTTHSPLPATHRRQNRRWITHISTHPRSDPR